MNAPSASVRSLRERVAANLSSSKLAPPDQIGPGSWTFVERDLRRLAVITVAETSVRTVLHARGVALLGGLKGRLDIAVRDPDDGDVARIVGAVCAFLTAAM